MKSGVNYTSLVHNGERLSQGRCVIPREYARMDVATFSLWSAMVSASLSTQPSHVNESGSPSFSYCVDKISVVSARDWFYGPRKAMHIGTPMMAKITPHSQNLVTFCP